MSLILDALNRADQERSEQNQTPSLHMSSFAPRPMSYPIKRWVLEVTIILIAVGGYYYFQSNSNGSGEKIVTTEAVLQPQMPEKENPVQTVPITAPVEVKPTTQQKAPVIENIDTKPVVTPPPVPKTSKAIDTLYQQQALVKASKTKAPQVKESLPAQATVTETMSVEQSIFQQMPLLAQMPKRFQQMVPSIEYSVHVYSKKDDAGFVTLNDKRQKIGDEVAPGLIIIKILEDSLVLDYKGTQFRLLSLNSWVNFK